jgi:hypothetical protein
VDESLAAIDYASCGRTIQFALVDHAKRFPDKSHRPPFILWDGKRIWNTDAIPVPSQGIVRGEILSAATDIPQGFDLNLHKGWIELLGGERPELLRTWHDQRYEDVVEYPFVSGDGLLRTWNVYEVTYPNGQKVEEKWTSNAGLWVETINDSERIYHCSHGKADPPDFESFVYKVSVLPK